jgi:hypothetical protein
VRLAGVTWRRPRRRRLLVAHYSSGAAEHLNASAELGGDVRNCDDMFA